MTPPAQHAAADSAEEIVTELHSSATPEEHAKVSKRVPADQVIGVRMKHVFDLAKARSDLPLDQVEALLDSHWYEARLAAICILDFRARKRGTTDEQRRELFELYLRRHDRIDSWDLVDRAAPRVIGWYLLDKPRDVLFDLARSSNIWERRTAITAAFWIIRAGDIEDPLAIAELLVDDGEHLIQASLGTALREIGRIDPARRDDFLALHGGRLTATARRTART